jgi:outer membrane protein OmpA-like peptidoglycan-associated protein
MKKSLLLLSMIFALAISSHAQNTDNPWFIGLSTNYADFNAVERSVGDFFTDADWMGKTIPGMIRVGRNISPSFNASAVIATLKLDPTKLNEIPLDRTIATDNFWKYGVQLEYKFANDYLLKQNSWFDPYIYLGMNGSVIDEVTYLSSSMGVGVNFWIIENFGVNAQGSYDYNWEFNDYFHYSFGLVVRFGATKDSDGDGISDKKDLCPDVFGLAQFNGCPDTDGDGIPDMDDLCPNTPGLAEFAGCPDTDGDGIPDKDDLCPMVAGLPEFDGCPDMDGDGIPDKDDLCPEIFGPAEYRGCPDTDGDGVPDNLDRCPDEPGPASNNGCPVPVVVVPVEVVEALNFNAENIQFNTSSSTIHNESFDELDNIIEIMNDYPDTRFAIDGYTDNTGSVDFNLKLSVDRANSVKNYFVENGISANRLEANGHGINNPIATNDTGEGRAKNRRVEIKLID